MNTKEKDIIYKLAIHYVLDTLTDKEKIIILCFKDEERELFKQMVESLSAPMA